MVFGVALRSALGEMSAARPWPPPMPPHTLPPLTPGPAPSPTASLGSTCAASPTACRHAQREGKVI